MHGAVPLQEQEPGPKGLLAALFLVGLKPHASTGRALPALVKQKLRTGNLILPLKPTDGLNGPPVLGGAWLNTEDGRLDPPTLPQRARKDGAPSVVVVRGVGHLPPIGLEGFLMARICC